MMLEKNQHDRELHLLRFRCSGTGRLCLETVVILLFAFAVLHVHGFGLLM